MSSEHSLSWKGFKSIKKKTCSILRNKETNSDRQSQEIFVLKKKHIKENSDLSHNLKSQFFNLC